MSQQRGIRNNNPGNIRRAKSAVPWMGLSVDQHDKEFLQFIDAKYGIRAMYKILLTYRKLHMLDTIEGIISRWAPPNENDTEAYVKSVCEDTGFTRDEELNIFDRKVAIKLLRAIIRHENSNEMPYSDEILNKAMELAL